MKRDYKIIDDTSNLEATKEKRIVLAGGTTFGTITNSDVPSGFAALASRPATTNLFGSWRKGSPKVQMYVKPTVFQQQRKRFALLLDAYLAYGLSNSKKEHILIGGVRKENTETHVDILVFSGGRLTHLLEKNLPDFESDRFRRNADALLAILKADHPKHAIKLAAPLPNWHIDGVEYVGAEPLKKLQFRPMAPGREQRNAFLVPGALIACSLAVNVGMIVVGYDRCDQAQDEFKKAMNSKEVQAAGGVDSQYISVLSHQRTFLEAARRQEVLPAKVLQIVKGIAVVQGVQIKRLQLPAPNLSGPSDGQAQVINAQDKLISDLISADRVPDAQFEISVPSNGRSLLTQGKEVVTAIAGSTGMSLRIGPQGMSEQGDSKRRTFVIEGFIHG